MITKVLISATNKRVLLTCIYTILSFSILYGFIGGKDFGSNPNLTTWKPMPMNYTPDTRKLTIKEPLTYTLDTDSTDVDLLLNKRCDIKYNFDAHKCYISVAIPALDRKYNASTNPNTGDFFINFRSVFTFDAMPKVAYMPMIILNKSCDVIKTDFIILDQNDTSQRINDLLEDDNQKLIYAGVIKGPVKHPTYLEQLGFSERYKKVETLFAEAFVGRKKYLGHTKFSGFVDTNVFSTFNTSWRFGEPFSYNLLETTYSDVLQQHKDLLPGGLWKPRDCVPAQRLAIIIPFRRRETHLWIFLKNMLTFLKLQNTEFTIFVVEQTEPQLFNRATLMNAGYLEAKKMGDFDCYVFHDVDVIPEDLTNYYACSGSPRHLMVSRSSEQYRQVGRTNFLGGVIAMTSSQIEKINGFPNVLYGWGGEDDEIRLRIDHSDMEILRYPPEISQYITKGHKKDRGNPHIGYVNAPTLHNERNKESSIKSFMKLDGLHNVNYTVLQNAPLALYTHIIVKIPGPVSVSQQKRAMKKFRVALALGASEGKHPKMPSRH